MESIASSSHGQVRGERKFSIPAVNSSIGLWIIVDGIGLAIVAGATILEGMHLWKESFHLFWLTQKTSLMYWFGGRSLQVSGLTVLIGTCVCNFSVYSPSCFILLPPHFIQHLPQVFKCFLSWSSLE